MSATKQLITLGDTKKLADSLAKLLIRGDVVTLAGDVGAGKTTFAQFLIHALSSVSVEVTSPTFTLLQTYPVTLASGEACEFYHYDLYRVRHEAELVELGFDDALREVTIIEWPERLGAYPMPVTLALSFVLAENGTRSIRAQCTDVRFKDFST